MRGRLLVALIVMCIAATSYLDLKVLPNHNMPILYAIAVLLASFTESVLLVITVSTVVIFLELFSIVVLRPEFVVWPLSFIALVVICYLALKVASQRVLIRHEVQESEQLRRNLFRAAIAHDLRTPLTVILGRAEQLERDPRLPVPLRDRVGTIGQAAHRMRQAIDDYLGRWHAGGGAAA